LSDERTKAIEAILRAARDAEQVPSYRTAAELYRQAWEMAEDEIANAQDDRSRRWALDAILGVSRLTVLYGSPATTDGERAAMRGRELAEALGDPEALALICSLHGMHIWNDRERFAEGLGVVEHALDVARRAELSFPAVRVSRGLALGYALDGRFDAARETIDWVIGELVRSGDAARRSDVYFGALWIRDSVRLLSDDLPGATEASIETYELALRAPNRTVEARSAARLAHLYLLRGDYASAEEWAGRSLRVAEEIDNLAAILTAAAAGLVARAATGEATGSGRYIGLLDHALPAEHHTLVNGHLVVEALLGAREVDRAEQVARLAYKQAGGRLRDAMATSALGAVLISRGSRHWQEAQEHLDRAISLAESIGARSVRAGAMLGAAKLAAARGDQRRKAEALEAAMAICQNVGLGHFHRRAERLLADAQSHSVGYA
jgi:tetratricopeptide (TPR) repeat protein